MFPFLCIILKYLISKGGTSEHGTDLYVLSVVASLSDMMRVVGDY
jgi:hypothetical protein